MAEIDVSNVDKTPAFLAGEMIPEFAKVFGDNHPLVHYYTMGETEDYFVQAQALCDLWELLGFKGEMQEVLPVEFYERHLAEMSKLMKENQNEVQHHRV